VLDETEVAIARNHEVVEEGYADDVASVMKAGRDLKVFRRWIKAARRVVVCDHAGDGIVFQACSEDLARMNNGTIN